MMLFELLSAINLISPIVTDCGADCAVSSERRFSILLVPPEPEPDPSVEFEELFCDLLVLLKGFAGVGCAPACPPFFSLSASASMSERTGKTSVTGT